MRKIILMLFCLNAILGFSQSATIENVRLFTGGKKSGQIIQNNKLVGYYVFIQKEKADKKNRVFEVKTYDENLNSTGNFEIIRSIKSFLTEVVFNGEVFLFQFYDRKLGLEFVTYSFSGKEMGKNTIPKAQMSVYETTRIEEGMKTGNENVSVFPFGSEGFIRNTYVKGKKTAYEIARIDNNANVTWTYSPDLSAAEVQLADIVDVNDGVITATVTRKRNNMTREMDMYCLLLNPENGKEIKEFQMGTEAEGRKSILKSFINPVSNNIFIIGEYYKPKDDYLKDKSQGLFCMELSTSGDEISTKEYAWKGDIDKFKQENVDEEDKKEADKKFNIFFHDVIVGKNGHMYLIGEQYRKQVSAGGMASKALAGSSSDASSLEIRIGNMILFELDENKNLIDFDLIKKRKSSVNLGEGGGLQNTTTMAYYLKSQGYFDYSFTARDKDSDHFTVVYIDGNRREDGFKKNDLMLGVIDIKEGSVSVTRSAINAETFYWWVLPAKPGNVVLGQYYRKDKKIQFSTVPLK